MTGLLTTLLNRLGFKRPENEAMARGRELERRQVRAAERLNGLMEELEMLRRGGDGR